MMPANFVRDLFRGLFPTRASDSSQPARNDSRAASPPAPAPDTIWNFFAPVFWATSDPDAVTEAMKKTTPLLAGGYYFGDNLLCWSRNNSMLGDAAFVAAWKANVESESDQAIVWRRYVLACAAYHCVQLDGDLVECGDQDDRRTISAARRSEDVLGYDVFEHDDSMAHHAMPAHGAELYDRVGAKFSRPVVPNASLICTSISTRRPPRSPRSTICSIASCPAAS